MGTENYDSSNPRAIEKYAQRLIDKSLIDVLGETIVQKYSGKGKLGQILEDLYFQYRPNSISQPDFSDAGVELKTTPIKQTSKGLVSKERLVFNIINFNEEYKNTFGTSTFWKKNQLLLLMFYLHEQHKIDLEYIFKIIRLWQFPAPDLKIIKDDWEKIISKIKDGKAHEISEGDTFYLGACTKGANKDSLVKQPFSDQKAMQRAFSLKSKYLNFIIQKSLDNEEVIVDYNQYDQILSNNNFLNEPPPNYRRLDLNEAEPIVKSIGDYKTGESFESLVIKKFEPYYNLTEEQILNKLGVKASSAKDRYYSLAKSILGVSKKKIEEFEKADVALKTIRLEKNGSLKESMSFAQIQFKEIVDEVWDESYWYNSLTKRFFFVVFQKDEEQFLRLKRVLFWTMPNSDLEIAHRFWEDTKAKIINNDFNSFMKISDNAICHVRPKGANGSDLMETSHGTKEKKKAYWLNSSYIRTIVSQNT